MAAAPEYDFEMQSGDTKRLVVTVLDANDVPVSLELVQSIKWWVAKKVTSTVHLFTKSAEVGEGITITDPPNGELRIDIEPADTEGKSGVYYHELEVIDSAGDIQTVLKGTMTVVRSLISNPAP
jgi:hypothetical protein